MKHPEFWEPILLLVVVEPLSSNVSSNWQPGSPLPSGPHKSPWPPDRYPKSPKYIGSPWPSKVLHLPNVWISYCKVPWYKVGPKKVKRCRIATHSAAPHCALEVAQLPNPQGTNETHKYGITHGMTLWFLEFACLWQAAKIFTTIQSVWVRRCRIATHSAAPHCALEVAQLPKPQGTK